MIASAKRREMYMLATLLMRLEQEA